MLVSNITGEHKKCIQELLSFDKSEFIIVSPFLASEMEAFLDEFDFKNLRCIDLITTFKPKDTEQLTKPFQLKTFLSYFKNRYPQIKVSIHVNNDLHGKLYISKSHEKRMIVTSANFTRNGMSINHEWGIILKNEDVIEAALEEVYSGIDYAEISAHQIDKACLFAEGNIKENPHWNKKPVITSDILKSVYSDFSSENSDPKFFLKPIGTSENPITLAGQQDFSGLHQKLHFSKKKPLGVRKGDYIITTAVGAGSLLSYFKVTGSIQLVAEEQIRKEPWLERWPWFVEGRNHSTNFGRCWWEHNLKRQSLLEEFKDKFPGVPVTHAGGFSLGTINMGNDKVRITKEFADFLIGKIQQVEPEKDIL